jgi:hypothetical protein
MVERLRRNFRKHVEALKALQGRSEPKPEELERVSLEEEFKS